MDNLSMRDPNKLFSLLSNPTQAAPAEEAAAQAPAQLPAADGKMAPEAFMQMIQQNPHLVMGPENPLGAGKNVGLAMTRNERGELGQEVPSGDPIKRLFGAKKFIKPESQSNYFDTLVARVGEDAAKALLPGETPLTPDGQPFLDAKTFDRISQGVGKASADDKPNAAVGKLALVKLKKTYGEDSPIYQNAKEYVDQNGGIPLSKFSEFVKTSMAEETPNFQKDASGRTQKYNRATERWETIPGQTVGIMQTLGDPASAAFFDKQQAMFEKDQTVVGLKKTLDTLSQASAQLESDNPASIGTFYSIIAKGVGKDAGALAEGDVDRSMGGTGYGELLQRFYDKKIDVFRGKSQFSETDLKDFRGLLRKMGQAADQRYQANLDRHVKSVVKALPGLDEEWVRGVFDKANRFTESENVRLPGKATGFTDRQVKPKSDPLGLF